MVHFFVAEEGGVSRGEPAGNCFFGFIRAVPKGFISRCRMDIRRDLSVRVVMIILDGACCGVSMAAWDQWCRSFWLCFADIVGFRCGKM